MKKLYLLLAFASFFFTAHSQNWQTVYSDRVQYFDSGVAAIKIQSVKVSGGDSTFWNYSSGFFNRYNKYDTSSWIGRRIVIKPNGLNGFIHTDNDTMLINTIAITNDTWNFLENDSVLVMAKVDSMGVSNHNGIYDSVKYISLRVVKLPKRDYDKPYYNFLDGKKIWLSKHYGMLRLPVLEAGLNFSGYFQNLKTEYYQTRENLFTNKAMCDFEAGDEVHRTFNSNFWYSSFPDRVWEYYFDTYLEKNYDSVGDSVRFKIQTRFVRIKDESHVNTNVVLRDTTTVYYRTYYSLSGQAFGVMPMSVSPFIINRYYSTAGLCATEFHIGYQNGCSLLSISQRELFTFEQYADMAYTARQGLYYQYTDASSGSGPYNFYQITERIEFVKNNCGEIGKKILLTTREIPLSENKITIYPNPAFQSITVQGEGIQSAEIADLSGRIMGFTTAYYATGKLTIDVASLAAGVYVVKVFGVQGVSTHKIIVNRW